MLFFFLFATGSWLIFIEHIGAALVNVTIDDSYGDPLTGAQIMYMPQSWNNATNCPACTARPDHSQTYLGTWHDNTWTPPANNTVTPEVQIASATFTGSAVHIFCIIAHSVVSPVGNTDMSFYIDDEAVGHYALLPSGASTYSYGINVYSNTSVPPGQHTIKIQNGLTGDRALILLDYITYSYDDGISTPKPSTTSSSHGFRPTIIASAIAGTLGFMLLFGLAVFFIRRRHRQWLRNPRNGFVVDAFQTSVANGVPVSELASRHLIQTPQSLSSDPPRRANPEISQVTPATASQIGLMFSERHVNADHYVARNTHRPRRTNSSSSIRDDIEVGLTHSNAQQIALLNSRQVQRRNRKLPPLPDSAGSTSAAEQSAPQDVPPAYSDAGRDPIITRDRGGEEMISGSLRARDN